MPYIVVEGLDFSGKSTLIKKFKDFYNCECVYEPFCNTPISKRIYDHLKEFDHSNHFKNQLFLASRIEMFTKLNSLTLLNSDKHLISDRNFISNAVYQSETDNELKQIIDVNISQLASYNFYPIPQVIVYIKIPFYLACERLQQRENPNELDKFVIREENYIVMQAKYEKALAYLSSQYNYLKIIHIDHHYNIEEMIETINDHLTSLNANINTI